jgi:hypothetical protein
MVHEAALAEATGKVNSHNPVVGSPEESDGNVVPGKSANKGGDPSGADGGKGADREEVNDRRRGSDTEPLKPVERPPLATKKAPEGWLQTKIPADFVST